MKKSAIKKFLRYDWDFHKNHSSGSGPISDELASVCMAEALNSRHGHEHGLPRRRTMIRLATRMDLVQTAPFAYVWGTPIIGDDGKIRGYRQLPYHLTALGLGQ